MIKREYLASLLLLSLAAILQSTLFRYISILGVKPDLVLIILVFIASRRGSMVGQISGFLGGFIEDLLSISPLGFNALIKTIIGYLYGIIEDRIVIDPIILPALVVGIATILKYLLAALISAIFAIENITSIILSSKFLIEILYNSLSAPFVFALLSLIKSLKPREKALTL